MTNLLSTTKDSHANEVCNDPTSSHQDKRISACLIHTDRDRAEKRLLQSLKTSTIFRSENSRIQEMDVKLITT